jgi:dTDP-4-amino-4,6-dideoxygalactose transaminase
VSACLQIAMRTFPPSSAACDVVIKLKMSPCKAENGFASDAASAAETRETGKEVLWRKLDLDTSLLRVETATALPLMTLQSLKKVIHECVSAGVSLLYWSPEPGVEADCESELVSQPWFTGYAVANAVLFRQDVVSSATGPLADVRDADAANQCDDVVSVPPSDKPDQALIDLGLVSGEHSRFRRDPALTRAQFEAMYRAWVCNSIGRKAADEVLVCRKKKTGEVAGMITLKLVSSDDGVGTDTDDGIGKNKSDKDATNSALPSQTNAASTVVIIGLLAVSPKYQRQGVGRTLMRAAFQWATKHNAHLVEVGTQEENAGAMRFYASQGFQQVLRKTNYHIWIPSSVVRSRVRFNVPYLTGREVLALNDVIESSALDSLGKYTTRCQEWMERTLGSPQALLTHSATAALEQAAILCGLKQGDEVIMPSYTFVSTANAVVLRGAVPVFVDVHPEDVTINESAVEAAVTGKTKAIIVVHYAGMPCDMDPIMALAKRHNLYVIEDAAQALLSKYKGRHLGTIGHFGCFSFHYTKNTVCGEGGALLVNDEQFLLQSRIVREKGTNRSDFMDKKVAKYEWLSIGSSFEPNELSAAFLLPQLEEASECSTRRLRVCFAYQSLLAPLEKAGKLTLARVADAAPDEESKCSTGNGHIFWIMFNSSSEREAAEAWMQKHGVQCCRHYVPLHLSEGGRRYARSVGDMRTTIRVGEDLLRLPVWYGMTWVHVHCVVQGLYNFFAVEAPSQKEVMGLFAPVQK